LTCLISDRVLGWVCRKLVPAEVLPSQRYAREVTAMLVSFQC